MTRVNIEFAATDGIRLKGWHYLPENGKSGVPTVVMCHGFGGVKEMHLDDVAAAFAGAGFAVVVFDHRGFGESDGEPRQEVDPWLQIRDLRDAISFAAALPQTDSDRIGLWGSSYSGGHVIACAAFDKRVRCVVSQVPLISGLENLRRFVRADQLGGFRAALNADRLARLKGDAPAVIPLVAENPADVAVMPTLDAWKFTEAEVVGNGRAPNFKNFVTLRSVDLFSSYEPGLFIHRVSPAPLLMIIAADDTVCAPDVAYAAFERALEPKKLVIVPNAGHFDLYVKHFSTASPAAIQWFREHLVARGA